MSLLIVGCGYVGMRVARRWQEVGASVVALTRGGADRVAQLQAAGIEAVEGDWLDTSGSWTLPSIQQILIAVPHREDDRFGVQTHAVGLANVLSRVPGVQRLVALSTTGVYQQSEGEWVDETSVTEPNRIGPQIALAAEQWLRDHLPAEQAAVLRLAGIYGPGRVPLIEKLRNREPIPVADGELNLIHLDDIAQAVVSLLRGPSAHNLYVLSDGHPVPRRTFYKDAARIFRTPPPEFIEPTVGSPRAQRSESQKRIRPDRILRDLNMSLIHQSHIDGLTAIHQTTSH